MSRKPFYRSADGWWYAQIRISGKRIQVKLVKGRDNSQQAYQAFCRLMAEEGTQPTSSLNQSLANICDLFLEYSELHNRKETYLWHKGFLQNFCERCGKLMVSDLKPLHVNRWLDSNKSWKNGRRSAIAILKRALNWAEDEGYITVNPIRRMKKPTGGKRQRILTDEERLKILDSIKDEQFREFILAMQETGCRPSEVAKVTAENVKLDLGVWVFEDHKTAAKTGKARVVYLSPTMLELSKKLIQRHPTGPLFRGPRNPEGYNRNSIRCRFRRLREKLPDLKHFSAYAYRHTYTTEALMNGIGVAQVAELLGHTSTDMVMRHYQHLSQKVEYMRDAAAKAVMPKSANSTV